MRTSHLLLGLGVGAALGLAAAAFAEDAASPQAETLAATEPLLGPVGYDAVGQPGRIHVVVPGDTLWDISEAYLGTPWVWPSVWTANQEIANPHLIRPGDRIWISATEMRRVSAEEAEALLAGAPAEAPPAETPAAFDESATLAPPDLPRGTYRYTEIQTTGFVSDAQLSGAATVVGSPMPRKWLGDHDLVQIGLGAGEVSPGDEFEIFRAGERVMHPATGEPYGYSTEVLGWLEVQEVHAESATGTIRLSRSEIQRGDHVLPRVRPDADIPIAARPQVEGIVVYTPSARRQMATNDVVFLDRGARHGLQVGAPLEVFRPMGSAYDDVRGNERALPDRIVAKLIVVDAHPEAAVAVITHSTEEINRGDPFRGSDSLR